MIWEVADRPTPFAGRVQIEQEDSTTQVPTPETVHAVNEELPPAITESTMPTAADSGADSLFDLLDAPPMSAATALPLQPSAEPAPSPLPDDGPDSTRPIHAIQRGRDEPSGKHFVTWLHRSIQTRKLIINDARALVHTVAGTVYLVSPGVFQRYVQEHPQVAHQAKQEGLSEWQWIQKRFEKLQLHRKQSNGLNIWACEVAGPRKSRRLHGYMLSDPAVLFDEMPCDNPYLRLLNDGHEAELPSQSS